MEESGDAIVALDLRKVYAAKTAVDGLRFKVARGRFFGFLGPNGAGKSTTIRMLTGLLRPTAGDAIIEGHRLSEDPLAVKKVIGILPEELPLYERLTGEEYLLFAARMHGLSRAEAEGRTGELLEFLSLAEDALPPHPRVFAGHEEEARPGRRAHPQPQGAVPGRAPERHRPRVRPRGHRPPAAPHPQGSDAVLHHPRAGRGGAPLRRGGR